MAQLKLGFGTLLPPTSNRGGESFINVEELKKMVDYFILSGFRRFDIPHRIKSTIIERSMRQTLTERNLRHNYELSSRLQPYNIEYSKDVAGIIDEQLIELGIEYFDYYAIECNSHSAIQRTQYLNGFELLKELKDSGKILKIGVCFAGPSHHLDELLRLSPQIDFIELQINYVDWLNSPLDIKGCHEVALRHHKPITAILPLKSGLLLRLPKSVDEFLTHTPSKLSAQQWALRFAASISGVDMVISDMNSMVELKSAVHCMRDFKELSEEEFNRLRHAATEIIRLNPIQCTNCNLCPLVCPVNIPIPKYLWILNEDIENPSNEELHRLSYRGASHGKGLASECIECQLCEDICPQLIRITDYLKIAATRFEPRPPKVN